LACKWGDFVGFRSIDRGCEFQLQRPEHLGSVGARQVRCHGPPPLGIYLGREKVQTTGIWNDFILGLIFAGRENFPITVQLNNIINSTQGEKVYNVNMAATLLTSMVPLAVYFVSGRWFVRGIAAGAVKG
jgi:hypothetical protein